MVITTQVANLREHLEPLRAGTSLVSAAELDALDAEWVQWRAEWVRRRKVFYKCALPLFSRSFTLICILGNGLLTRPTVFGPL